MEKKSAEFPQISIFGPVRRCMKPGSLQHHTGKCAFCIDTRFTFLGSPFPQLPFDIIIALVQHGTVEKWCPEFSQISIFGPVRHCMKPGSLQPHTGKSAFCTDSRITFLGSPFPQLPFYIMITFVQTRYRGKKKRQISSNFHIRPYSSLHETG